MCLSLLKNRIQSKTQRLRSVERKTSSNPDECKQLRKELEDLNSQYQELSDDIHSELQKFPLDKNANPLEDVTPPKRGFLKGLATWTVQTAADVFADAVYFPFTVASVWMTVKQEDTTWFACLKEFIEEVQKKNKFVLDGFAAHSLFSILHSLLVPYPMYVVKKILGCRSEAQMVYFLDYFFSYNLAHATQQPTRNLDLHNTAYAGIAVQCLINNSIGYSISSGIVKSALFPLWTLKTLLIAQGSSPLVPIRNHSLVTLAEKIYSSEGMRGFYRGFSAHLALTAWELVFWYLLSFVGSLYYRGSVKRMIADVEKENNYSL